MIIYINKSDRVRFVTFATDEENNAWKERVHKAGLIACDAKTTDSDTYCLSGFTSEPTAAQCDAIRIFMREKLDCNNVAIDSTIIDDEVKPAEEHIPAPSVPEAFYTFKYRYEGKVTEQPNLTYDRAEKLYNYSVKKNVECLIFDGEKVIKHFRAEVKETASAVSAPSAVAKAKKPELVYFYFHKKDQPWQRKVFYTMDEAMQASVRGGKAGYECTFSLTPVFG